MSPDLIAPQPTPPLLEERFRDEGELIALAGGYLKALVQSIKDHNALSAEYERECL